MSFLRLVTEHLPRSSPLVLCGLALPVALVALLAVASAANGPREAPRHVFFTIATGSTAGTYFPVGDLFAAIISHPAGSVRCEVEELCGPTGLIAVAQASEGSVRNVALVAEGRASSAFAQADVVYRAIADAEAKTKPAGEKATPDPVTDLRAIAGLYPESLHLIAAVGSGIETLEDLKGKRISIDRPGSGTNPNARLVLESLGLDESEVTLSFLDPDEATEQVLFGAIDAYFLMAGVPVRVVNELVSLNLVTLVPIEGPDIETLIASRPYLETGLIPKGTYGNLPEVATLDVRAVWIVHKDADPVLIYDIARAVFAPGNRQLLDNGHPVGKSIRLETATEGVPIAFHPGAERYYRESGLIDDTQPEPAPRDRAEETTKASKPAADRTAAPPRVSPRS